MGLDGVELIIAYEEQFGVCISDAEAAELLTPHMVCDLIMSKLTLTDSKVCQSQRAFYLLRKEISSLFERSRKSITPDTLIADFIPQNQAIESWMKLKECVQARTWPHLSRPVWLVGLLAALSCFSYYLSSPLTILIAGPIALITACGGAFFTKNFKNTLPKEVRTVKDLVPYAITSDEIPWTKEKVSECVKIITIEILGLSESNYFEDADFINDLGVD